MGLPPCDLGQEAHRDRPECLIASSARIATPLLAPAVRPSTRSPSTHTPAACQHICAHLALGLVAAPALTPQPLLRQAEDGELVLGVVRQILQAQMSNIHQLSLQQMWRQLAAAHRVPCIASVCGGVSTPHQHAYVQMLRVMQGAALPGYVTVSS